MQTLSHKDDVTCGAIGWRRVALYIKYGKTNIMQYMRIYLNR